MTHNLLEIASELDNYGLFREACVVDEIAHRFAQMSDPAHRAKALEAMIRRGPNKNVFAPFLSLGINFPALASDWRTMVKSGVDSIINGENPFSGPPKWKSAILEALVEHSSHGSGGLNIVRQHSRSSPAQLAQLSPAQRQLVSVYRSIGA